MPPYVPRKRLRSSSPPPDGEPPAKRLGRSPVSASKGNKKKPTLFEAIDAKPKSAHSVEDNKKFLAELDVDDEEEDELSDLSSDDFEDAMPSPPSKRRKTNGADTEDEDEDNEMDWEDAIVNGSSSLTGPGPVVSGDLELTLDHVPTHTLGSLTDPHGTKKGPSKIERQIRVNTHCLHVSYLLFHNLVRNSWVSDKQVHKALVETLTPGVKREVERWLAACGGVNGKGVEEVAAELKDSTEYNSRPKGKTKAGKPSKIHKNQRDWGHDAEEGAPNLNHGDPTLRLLKILSAFWRKRFTITAPGMRKQGYKDLARLEEEVNSHRNKEHNAEEHGERIKGVSGFRKLARNCEGSRDVGAQLFTALLRGLGLEARVVANLQPVGFGWSKSEEAHPKKQNMRSKPSRPNAEASESEEEEDEEVGRGRLNKPVHPRRKETSAGKLVTKSIPKARPGGGKNDPIALLDDDSELSSAPASEDDEDDDSVIDVTPAAPMQSHRRYDRDLPFPVYWTEVLSPVSHTWISVDPIVLSVVANNQDGCVAFEPRGAKADRVKQILAYVVAYSADGTAKDVTVRYLKRHQWPGKTKGVRIPVEKMPIYNKRGKVLRYEDYDWFKSIMAPYARPSKLRTKADKIEEENELQPVRVVREAKIGTEETLGGYKASAEFVLERHLRREEALLPHAKPVKTFATGKGDKAKSEPVYRRQDVVPCRTIESWHKEGRAVKEGERPLKHVPMRAVTLIRKREIEEAERETGEKLKQGLYSRAQTEWIIPPPIVNGVIPKNTFNNIDVYVPTMVPKGAVHIRLRGTARVCKKLGVDFAEACTGFEFGNKRAVPVLTGVVVAKENEGAVRDAWRAEEEEKRKKERLKREKLALGMWKKLLAGLRIVERVRKEYGDQAESHIDAAIHPMASKKTKKGKAAETRRGTYQRSESPINVDDDKDNDPPGGFLYPDYDALSDAGSGGFLHDDHDAPSNHEGGGGGGFILNDNDGGANTATGFSKHTPTPHPRTPVSLQSLHAPSAAEEQDDASDPDDSIAPGKPTPRKRGRPAKAKNAKSTPARKRVNKGRAGRVIATPEEEDDGENEDEGEDEVAAPPSPVQSSESEFEEVASRKRRKRGGAVGGKGGRRGVATGRKSGDGLRSRWFGGGDDDDVRE